MRSWLRSALPFLLLLLPAAPAARADEAADLASSRRLFEKNLQAIRDKDRDSYLS